MDVESGYLEEFLDDVYHTDILFKIDENEVAFIQTGVETLVQIIADIMWKDAFNSIKEETENLVQKFPELRISRNGKYSIDDIVKVGSFYERTKNGFPDQFDFIFLMCIFESNDFPENRNSVVTDVSRFHAECRDILSSCVISFPSLDEKKKFIRFDRYIERKGPVLKLRFVYGNDTKEMYIYVNFVPAFKVLVLNYSDEIVDQYGIPDFNEEIKRTGSLILIQGHVCFIETELFFIKNILSSKHVKVYRILKYLVNARYNNQYVTKRCTSEFWNVFSKSTPMLVTSYQMKRAVILHHFECKNVDCENTGPCFLGLLENLKDKRSMNNANDLHELFTERRVTLAGYKLELLENLLTSFKAMQGSSQPRSIKTLDLNVCPADTPLLHKQEVKDNQRNETQVTLTGLAKFVCPYFSYFVLISMCGAFAILILNILSYRS